MKKLIALLTVAVLSVAAFAAPMVSPYFEIENVGVGAAPTLEMGALLEADLASDWAMDLGAFYLNDNILVADRSFWLGFDAGVYFDETLKFVSGKYIKAGGSLAFGSLANYEALMPASTIHMFTNTSDFLLNGFIGPVSLWGGLEFKYTYGATSLDLTPTIGIRVEFNIPLERQSTNI